MKIFVSSQSVRSAQVASLIEGLRLAKVTIEHSPRNPIDGDDPRWRGWYEVGLPAAVERCNAFVAVIDRAWDSSTWMACEAEVATKKGRPLLYWNPDGVKVTARGMVRYLREELPPNVDEAVEQVLRRGAG